MDVRLHGHRVDAPADEALRQGQRGRYETVHLAQLVPDVGLERRDAREEGEPAGRDDAPRRRRRPVLGGALVVARALQRKRLEQDAVVTGEPRRVDVAGCRARERDGEAPYAGRAAGVAAGSRCRGEPAADHVGRTEVVLGEHPLQRVEQRLVAVRARRRARLPDPPAAAPVELDRLDGHPDRLARHGARFYRRGTMRR